MHVHHCIYIYIELPYGDQGLFMWRDTFDSVGGYPMYRLMEDFEMVRHIVMYAVQCKLM